MNIECNKETLNNALDVQPLMVKALVSGTKQQRLDLFAFIAKVLCPDSTAQYAAMVAEAYFNGELKRLE